MYVPLPPGQLTNLVRAVYIPIRPPIACPMKLVFAIFKLLSSRTISPEQERNYFHGIHETSIWSKLGKISSSSDLKCSFLWVSPLLLINQKCASHFRRGTTNENKQLKETKTWRSNTYLIRQWFKGYRYKSGFAIFALKSRLQST